MSSNSLNRRHRRNAEPWVIAGIWLSLIALGIGATWLMIATMRNFAEYEPTPFDPPRLESLPDSPCTTADGPPPCYWDSSRIGYGRSFWLDSKGNQHYLAPGAHFAPPTHNQAGR